MSYAKHNTQVLKDSCDFENNVFLSLAYFIVEDKRYDIVEFDRPDCPYIILDILSKEKGITRGIHVIKMENKNSIRLVNNSRILSISKF